MSDEDFSAEDSAEWVGGAATSEFQRTIERIKYQERRAKLLFLRSLGFAERKRLKKKYHAAQATHRK